MKPNSSNTTTIKKPIRTLIQPFLNKMTMRMVTPIICPMIIAALVNEVAIVGSGDVDDAVLEVAGLVDGIFT
jgi:hypothetical protein